MFKDSALSYNKKQYIEIFNKVSFAATMTWTCMGVILACGIVITPLMGRIQGRIMSLMSIFFVIDKSIKEKMVVRILRF